MLKLKMVQSGLSDAAQKAFFQLTIVCELTAGRQFKTSTDYTEINNLLAYSQKNINSELERIMLAIDRVLSQKDKVILLDIGIISIDGKCNFGEKFSKNNKRYFLKIFN